MHSPRVFLAARVLLCLLIVGGFAIWFFVRAPEGTSATAIFRDVQLTGRADQLVQQSVSLVRKTVALHDEGSSEQLAPARSQLLLLSGACSDLTQEIRSDESQWIPAAEAADLLEQCQDVCQLTIDRMLTTAAPEPPTDAPPSGEPDDNVSDTVGPTEQAGPAETEITIDQVLAEKSEEAAAVLEVRSEQLLERSVQLQQRVEQAIERGLFARGQLLGFSASALLLICVTLAALIGLAVAWHASRRLKIAPERLIEAELELTAQKDRSAALRGCHERVQELLELADGFCRDGST